MGDRKTGLVRISNVSKLQLLADDRVSIFIDSKEVYKYIAQIYVASYKKRESLRCGS